MFTGELFAVLQEVLNSRTAEDAPRYWLIYDQIVAHWSAIPVNAPGDLNSHLLTKPAVLIGLVNPAHARAVLAHPNFGSIRASLARYAAVLTPPSVLTVATWLPIDDAAPKGGN